MPRGVKPGLIFETDQGKIKLNAKALKAVKGAMGNVDSATHHSSFYLAVTERMFPVPSREIREAAWNKLVTMRDEELAKLTESVASKETSLKVSSPKKRKNFAELADRSDIGLQH